MSDNKIYFKTDEFDNNCLDRCTVLDNGRMIGSINCRLSCKYNEGFNLKENWVKCRKDKE
jgi:hypothetical protein